MTRGVILIAAGCFFSWPTNWQTSTLSRPTHGAHRNPSMKKLGQFLIWIFIAPGDLIADRLNISQENNRDLVRMLINSLFWIGVALVGLAIWTSRMPEFQ